jgi:carbonic anhydrase/acetyltransferase-like protein (isoleucine patch superfamily)
MILLGRFFPAFQRTRMGLIEPDRYERPAMNIRPYRNTTPLLGRDVYIDPSAVVIGDVGIGDHSSVWPGAVIRGDVHRIRIGIRTSVQDNSVLHVTHDGPYNPGGFPLIIGDEVTIGHQVTLHGCQLGNRILVGIGATILDGVEVQDEVIIGAGSLVTPGKVLESRQLYVGRPAKAVRALNSKEIDFFRYTAGKYVDLAA